MGAVADGALGANGKVIGIIPRGLFKREGLHMGLLGSRRSTPCMNGKR